MTTYDPAAMDLERPHDLPIVLFLTENLEAIRRSITPRKVGPVVLRGSTNTSLISILTDLLIKHPLFGVPTQRFVGNGGFGTSADQTSPMMLEVAAKDGPQGSIEWLRRLISCTSTELNVISVVSGVRVMNDIEFLEGHRLTSVMSWSSKAQKMMADPIDFSDFLGPTRWGKADAFLWKRITCKVIKPGESPHYEPEKVRTAQTDLLKALALHDTAAPTSSTWWHEYEDRDFKLARHGDGGHFGQRDDGPEQHIVVGFHSSDAQQVNKFLNLKGIWRNKCQIALSALHLSRRIMSPSSRAIQLCIAAEALLGSDANTEIAHRVSTRSSILLGESLEGRLRIKKRIKALYGMRSQAVHGMAKDGSHGWEIINETAPDILRLCRLAITHQDGFPLDHIDLMGCLPTPK